MILIFIHIFFQNKIFEKESLGEEALEFQLNQVSLKDIFYIIQSYLLL